MHKMNIEYDLIPVKAVNFLSQAAFACVLPYKSIFQKQLGMSPAQNGIIQAVEKFMSLISPPFVGAVADKFSMHKAMMILCCLISIVFTLPMDFIPPIHQKTFVCCFDGNLYCNSTVQDFTNGTCNLTLGANNLSSLNCIFNNETSISCEFAPNTTNECHNSFSTTCQLDESEDVYGLTFWLLLLLSALYVIAYVPLTSLVDATTMYMLGPERMQHFGKQRLWGAVGFGMVGLLIGFLIDTSAEKFTSNWTNNFLIAFIGFATFQVVTAVVCTQLKVPKHKILSILTGLGTLVRNVRTNLLLCVVFFSGFNLGTRYAYMFWYVEHLPGSSKTLFGFAILTGCLSEIPPFFASGWVMDKLGFDIVLSLGLIVASVQCYLYAVITVAWPVLLIEALHGISFALPMAAMCTYASVLAPKGMMATLIGLTQGVYWGLGNMTGSLVSGVLYKVYDAKMMFKINAIIGCTAAILYYVAVKLVKMFEHNDDQSTERNVEVIDPMLDVEKKSDEPL